MSPTATSSRHTRLRAGVKPEYAATMQGEFNAATLTFTTSAVAQSVDFPLRHEIIQGSMLVLKIEETNGSPVATDDVDVQFRPLAYNAEGTLATTQQAFEDIKNAADFDTSSRLHTYDLNQFIAVSGDIEQHFAEGFRINLNPAASCTGTFVLTLIVR